MAAAEWSAELEERRTRALAMGGEEKLAARRAQGVLNARERLDYLFDSGSFSESGLFATSPRPEMRDRTPADGKVTGFGRVDGRPVAAVSNDFTVLGASSSRVNGKKIRHVKTVANKRGLPLVFLGESTGARMPDVMGAAGIGSADDPVQYQRLRETPWASGVLGHCYGSSSWYTALADFVVIRRGAVTAVASPRLTSMAISEDVDPEEMGGWRVHTAVSGMADVAVDTDEQALDQIKRFLSYMPSHCNEVAPYVPPEADADDAGRSEHIMDVLPGSRTSVYDMRQILRSVADPGSVFELKSGYGRSIVTALARIDGSTVGIIANNPLHKAGAIDADACSKATSFLVLCDSFNIPLVFFADQPGFLIGKDGERKGITGRVMNWMNALALCTVPKIAIICRKSYGQAVLNMGLGGNSDEVCAWTTAEISFMDPRYAAQIVHGSDVADDPERYREAIEEMTRDTSAYDAASSYSVQNVIDPRETRNYLRHTLDVHRRNLRSGIGEHRMSAWPTTVY